MNERKEDDRTMVEMLKTGSWLNKVSSGLQQPACPCPPSAGNELHKGMNVGKMVYL